MTDTITIAIVGASAAIVGGVLTGIFEVMYQWWTRPQLELDFESNNDAFLVESSYETKTESRTSTHVRVRLINKGKSIARDCRVYLTDIVEIDGPQVHPTKLYDAKEIAWAGFPTDYNPRHIPVGINFFLDIVRFSKGNREWNWNVSSLFASQISVKSYAGTYKVTIVATAANAKPKSIHLFITFTGDYYSLRTSSSK